MLIAQITDTHVRANGALAFEGKVDTSARLAGAVATIVAMQPRPDIVLATGDLVDTGSADDYRQLVKLLAPLPMPLLPIPGNHDARAPLLAAFPEVARRVTMPFVQYTADDHPLRLVALDTTEEDRIGGVLCPERLEWIERTLAASSRPTIVFMHHPPFDSGIAANDDMRCEGAEALARIVARNPQVQAVLCGHLHRSIARRWAGTLVITGAATAPTLELMIDGRGPRGWIDTPPMLGLHLWREGDGLVSHVVAADERARYAAFGT